MQWTAAEHTQTVVSHAREVSDPMRVLEQGPDRQRAPGCCSGGLSSMLWSLPVVDVVTMPPGKNFRLWAPPLRARARCSGTSTRWRPPSLAGAEGIFRLEMRIELGGEIRATAREHLSPERNGFLRKMLLTWLEFHARGQASLFNHCQRRPSIPWYLHALMSTKYLHNEGRTSRPSPMIQATNDSTPNSKICKRIISASAGAYVYSAARCRVQVRWCYGTMATAAKGHIA